MLRAASSKLCAAAAQRCAPFKVLQAVYRRRVCKDARMANFQDSRFLGISPRTIGLGIVAVGVVVGLFFIPETVKFLFDAKPRSSRERVATSKAPAQKPKPTDEAKAALAPDSLNELNSRMQRSDGLKDAPERGTAPNGKSARKPAESDDGIFSGLNFQVKANPGGAGSIEIPSSLSFDRLLSKEAASFFKKGRSAIKPFLRREDLLGTVAEEAVAPLLGDIDLVASGAAKNISAEELGARLRQDHARALRGLRSAGADRGALMRWLELPIIQFIDQRGDVMAARRIGARFIPAMRLTDLNVRQRYGTASGGTAEQFKATFGVYGSDIKQVAVYANGRLLKTYRLPKSAGKRERTISLAGDAQGVVTVIAYDAYGARPFAKNYAFSPRVRVFRKDMNGVYQIGFLPGSAQDSLDRFFYVGGTTRSTTSDAMITQF